MLYTFTHYATLYELYVGVLRGLISLAVFLSMLISLDRIYKVRGASLLFHRALPAPAFGCGPVAVARLGAHAGAATRRWCPTGRLM
jgi:hypothetical protein